ncbi:acyl-CoA N-acyltransferase [Mucor mucedo]|uniref:acyl-CoA N-acyltransferase n=1 Tax=Mucor mucedo TaxID=29922 RepID=UPI002220921F|nr:acyl-CoA N-acyltransferase [Mucor mucedo]KAI7873456.1 acyl-CoA N-acyltransferase [Mucor mucedo]
MTISYYVRQVTLEDIKFAQEGTDVYNSAYTTHDGWTTEASIVQGKLTDKATPNNSFMIGNDAHVVGTLMIVPFPDLQELPTPGEAMITRFAVSPDHQSKGLGRLLIEGSFKVMREQGYERCSIRVFENRPEILAWYTKVGFKDTNERKKLVLPVGFVIMKLDL